MDTGDCQPLYHAIRDYYEGLNMRIDQQIPMLLVERLALNDAIEGEKHVKIFQSFSSFLYVYIQNILSSVINVFDRVVSTTCLRREVYVCLKSRL